MWNSTFRRKNTDLQAAGAQFVDGSLELGKAVVAAVADIETHALQGFGALSRRSGVRGKS